MEDRETGSSLIGLLLCRIPAGLSRYFMGPGDINTGWRGKTPGRTEQRQKKKKKRALGE
jgi:hypothetical protein